MEDKKVYNSISELIGGTDPAKIEDSNKQAIDAIEAWSARSGDLSVINNLDLIAPHEERDDRMKTSDKEMWADIDRYLDESFKESDRLLAEALETKRIEEIEKEDERIIAEELESLDSEEDEDEESPILFDYATERKRIIKNTSEEEFSSSMFDEIENDFADELEDDSITPVDEEKEKENLKNIQGMIKSHIKSINKPIDISSFSISKKVISANKVIKNDENTKKTIDWVLYNSGKKITLSEFKGYEIDMLSTDDRNRNGRSIFRMYQDIYKLIYSHVVDDNKVPFESWIKSIKYTDINDLYFAIYQASFVGSNSMPYSCTGDKCENIFMKEIPFEDMIEYKNDEVKEKVQELLNSDHSEFGVEDVEIIMISDNYAFGIKVPSIYNIFLEMSLLDDKFTEKYSSFLGLISYIDEIYYIDRESQSLVPIDVSISERNKPIKALKNKVLQYSKIIRTLTSDQFTALQTYTTNLVNDTDNISYKIPTTTCPKCNTEIKGETTSAEALLFTRKQLSLIANSSIN